MQTLGHGIAPLVQRQCHCATEYASPGRWGQGRKVAASDGRLRLALVAGGDAKAGVNSRFVASV